MRARSLTNLPNHHIRYLDPLDVIRASHPPFLSLLPLLFQSGNLDLKPIFQALSCLRAGKAAQSTHMMGPTPWFLNYSISDFVC